MPLSAEPLRFEWKPGEVHKFKVVQTTTTVETLAGITSTTTNKMALAKTWTVGEVKDGRANLTMAITALRIELTKPVDGKAETSILDSATAEGAEAMKDYLNKPILTCTVDDRGRVSDVKATAPDAASRLQAELPFRIELPEAVLAADSKWERPFAIKLDPPAGTGETHDALQSFAVKSREDARTAISVSTSLKTVPKEIADLQPLLPWLWEGTVTFDPKTKRYLGSKLSVVREYPNHAGVGTKFSFSSAFEEARE